MTAHFAGSAQSTPETSFQIAASISAGCLVNNASPGAGLGNIGKLDFGTVSSLTQAVQTTSLVASGSIFIRCTPGLALAMSIDGGLNQSGGNRYLKVGVAGALLEYSLFSDAAFQQVIGIDAPVGVDTSSEEDISLPIYGRLTVQSGRPAGAYVDRLTVTLEW